MKDILNILNEIGIDKSISKAKLNELPLESDVIESVVKPLLEFVSENITIFSKSDMPIPLHILNHLPIGVVIVSNKKIKYLNDTLKKYLGNVNIVDADYNQLIELIHVEDRAAYSEYISKLQMNIDISTPLQIKTLFNGITRWVELKAHKVRYENEIAIQIVIVDISEKILAGINRDVVENIAIDIERKRLIADKLIEQNARVASVGLIASGLTHEINQPLNAIKIGADGLLIWDNLNPGVFTERVLKIIRTIAKSTDKIDEIIKQLRSYWTGNSDREPRIVSINDAILQSEKLLGQKLKSHDIKFTLCLNESVPKIFADKMELELIINNLIINSVKSFDLDNDSHDKKIIITTELQDTDVVIKYSDNGTLLSEVSSALEYSDYAFLKLPEIHFSIELSIVKLFVIANSGTIKAYTNAENGSDIIIKFCKYSN